MGITVIVFKLEHNLNAEDPISDNLLFSVIITSDNDESP